MAGSSQPAGPTVGQVLMEYLALEGVDTVFGIPGGGLANLLVEFKNRRKQVKYVICRHETGAAYIADGYHRATGKLGVVMVTSGPGATNALTGAVNAENGGTAMLVISGEVKEQFFGKGYLQEGTDTGLDIDAIYKAATDYSAVVVDQSDFQALFEQALRDAWSIPRRAVHLSLPDNVSAEAMQNAPNLKSTSQYRTEPHGAPRDLAGRALEMFLSAKKPLLFLGSGCRQALRDSGTLAALTSFVERYGIPVMTTADGKGIFPETHDLSLRNFGFASCAWPRLWMTPSYDALMVVGSALLGLATENWTLPLPTGPLIQVDLDQHVIGRAFPIALGVVAEAGAFFHELNALAQQFPPNPQDVASRKQAILTLKHQNEPFLYPDQYKSEAAPIYPSALVRVLQQTLPKDSMIMLDPGNAIAWGINCFVVDPPMQIHSSLAMGPMGFGVGSVVGAKIGRPDLTCIALVGDGAFMMHGAEVSTAAHSAAGAIWVVLYDDNLLMVAQGQENFFNDPNDPTIWEKLYRFGNPDLVKFAEGLGADAYSIDSPAQLKEIMPSVLQGANNHNRPQVIVAHINRRAFSPYFKKRTTNQ